MFDWVLDAHLFTNDIQIHISSCLKIVYPIRSQRICNADIWLFIIVRLLDEFICHQLDFVEAQLRQVCSKLSAVLLCICSLRGEFTTQPNISLHSWTSLMELFTKTVNGF